MFLRRQFHTASKRLAAYPFGKSNKPLTPYLAFAQSIRKSVTSENPDAKVPEIGKILGQRWNQLSESEKEDWKTKYKNAVEKLASK